MTSSPTSLLADPGRLAALRQTDLLDTPAEEAFDRLARLAARVLRAPIALVSLVDEDRQFFKACLGLSEPWASARQTPLSHSVCQHLVLTGQPLVIRDSSRDPPTSGNPAVVELGIVAYLGIPLVMSSGHVLGSFCVADRRPRDWTPDDVEVLTDLAGLAMTEIELRADIRASRQVEAALAENSQRLRGALEAVTAAVVITTASVDGADPEIVYANQAFCDLTGYPIEELLGGSPHVLEGPGIVGAAFEAAAVRLQPGLPWAGETVNCRKDGSEYIARWQIAALRDAGGRITHWVSTQQDVTPRRELERRLADIEASFQALLERVPAVVYTISPQAPNQITYVSPQIEALLGEPAANCIGDPDAWNRWLHPDDAEWVVAECERTNRTGEPFAAEYRVRTRTGEVRWVRDEAFLVRDAVGRPLFWQGILTDITASRLTAVHLAEALEREQVAAEQLTAALERERAAAEHLRAVDEMKTTFLQAVSHDLRTPLTTVLGIALTLERGAVELPAADIADLLHRLSGNARKLDRLLSDLLDLDRLARGTLSPRRQVIDVASLTRRIVDEADVAAQHPLVMDLSAVRIAVDAPKVERIVENLVINAARHTAEGTPIWVRVHSRDGGVLLRVEDEGPGVPPQLREQIFQPFHQGRNVAAHAPGSGIGLALVAQFASLHGGHAWVEDRPGGGASFRVFLPGTPTPDPSR